MNKIGHVGIVVAFVIVAYLLLLIVGSFLAETANTANATMTASSNMSNYPGTSGMLISTPWILFFVPGGIGIIVIVMILRRK